MDSFNITKQNGNIAFCEDSHTYLDITDPSKKFISVTTLIERFGQPFDKMFWSAYKALEKLIPKDAWTIEKRNLLATKKFDKIILDLYEIDENTFNREQQNILDNWDEENRKSCERGTKIHADLETSFYKKKKNIDISKYQIGGTFECRQDYTDLDLENAVYPEYLIHRVSPDGKLCIAGQIDLLVKKGNHITIGDWKGLPLNTWIPMATCRGKLLQDIEVGDYILDMNGKPTKVLHKSEKHFNPCYKITFDTGDSIVADHEHRWLLTNSEVKHTESLKIKDRIPIHTPSELIVYQRQRAFLVTVLNAFKNEEDICTIEFSKYGDWSDYISTMRDLTELGVKTWIDDEAKSLRFYKRDLEARWKGKDVDESRKYKVIIDITPVSTVPTQCLEVDSPTHTFLCGDNITVTHNTNKKIETKGFFDSKSKSETKMKYPLNNLPECNYSHYNLQLSTYAWMLQKLNPDFIIDDLVLVHFDHNDNMTIYHLPYLKTEVEKMLAFYKKQARLDENARLRQKIEY